YRRAKRLAVTSNSTITPGRTRHCLTLLRLMCISSTTRACCCSNSKRLRKRPEKKEKRTGWNNEVSANRQWRGNVQVRVKARSSILGQIRRPFFNINDRILATRVPKPKTTHFIPRFCLIEKKLDKRR